MPSGPKKRKSMKKKMECLHVITTIPQENGESDTGSGISSPMSFVAGQFEGEKRKENGREETGSGEIEEDMVNSKNVGLEVSVGGGEDLVIITKSPPSSHTAVAVPILQQKVITVDHEKKPAKAMEIGNPELMYVPAEEAGKEKSENSMRIIEEPVSLCEEALPVFDAKEVAEHVYHVLFEKVNSLISGQPPSSEEEEKVETLTSGRPPSVRKEEKEENIELRDFEESPLFYETEGKVEIFGSDQPSPIEKEHGVIASAQTVHDEGEQKCKLDASYLVERVASHNEEKVISLYDCGFKENMADGVEKQVIMFPQEVLRTSWLSCCGIFDAFYGQKK